MSLWYRIAQAVSERVIVMLDSVVFYLLFPGSPWFWIVEKYYLLTFDRNVRQRTTATRTDSALRDWENPKVVGRHRQRMRSSFISVSSRSAALSCWRGDKQETMSAIDSDCALLLTGQPGCPAMNSLWTFQLVGDPESCPLGWEKCDFDAHGWLPIQLPNHWQLQGYDIPMYTNTSYPFRFDPPFAVRDGTWTNAGCDLGLGTSTLTQAPLHPNEPGPNSTGLYRCSIKLPDEWDIHGQNSDDRVYLVFEGVDSCVSVWVNGVFVGYGQDSCLSCEFDVTSALRSAKGEHTLAVQVSRWCDGSYLEDQDKWWLSGIYREVYLLRRPRSFLSDFEFFADVSLLESSGVVTVQVDALAEGVQAGVHAVRMELCGSVDEQPICSMCAVLSEGNELPQRQRVDVELSTDFADVDLQPRYWPGVVTLRASLQNPVLWSAETPTLFVLVLTLYSSLDEATLGGEGLHAATCRVGIRSVQFGGENNCLLVNGRQVTIAGINRLEFEPRTGRAVSKASMLHDAKLLKAMNFNAVRSAHYPQHSFWLDVCDQVGLYFIDEANIETHGFQAMGQPIGYLSHQDSWRSGMACRVTRMHERDKNHACVIGWSLGNESGYGPTHELMGRWLKARDPSRFVQYESGGARTAVTDIICPMYQRPGWCEEQSMSDSRRRPVVLCEYAHAMGNSGGSLGEYWKYFRSKDHPRMQGGFIWDFVDQGLVMDGQPGYKYGGDFGDMPNTHNFCCNGLTAPDRSPYPSMYEVRFLQCPAQVALLPVREEKVAIEVENCRSFCDLSDVEIILSARFSIGVHCAEVNAGSVRVKCGSVCAAARKTYDVTDELDAVLALFVQSEQCQALRRGAFPEDRVVEVMGWLDVAVLGRTFVSDSVSAEISHTSFVAPELHAFLMRRVPLPAPERIHPSMGVINVDESQSEVRISWESGARATVSAQSGLIVSWTNSRGQELLQQPLDICMYRAPTDNDVGGSIFSYASRWKDAGLHNLERDGHRAIVVTHAQGDGSVLIRASWTLKPSNGSSGREAGIVLPCSARYELRADGTIAVGFSVDVPVCMPPLARFGIRAAITNRLVTAQWMGRGPHEAYDDRKASAYLGVFAASVKSLHTPYIRPQENGRRADPRWVKFVACDGESLVVVPNPGAPSVEGYGFSASAFSLEQLCTVRHDHELIDDLLAIHIHLDSCSMGVGGYDSWSPNVDERFLVKPKQGLEVTALLAYRAGATF